jgi:3-oxoacyl-[acyl-carrier protein] reductase
MADRDAFIRRDIMTDPQRSAWHGKVALVTGGGRGIGKAIALALAAEGMDVAVNYRARDAEAKAAAEQIRASGRAGIAMQADVAVQSQVQALVRRVETEMGPIAVLINNAGSAQPQPWHQITEADWDAVVDNNLKSAFLVTQGVLPGMVARKWGRIVMISSGAAQTGGVVGVHYTSAKAGMIGMTRAYAKAVVKDGVTVNAVAPALIDTEMRVGDRASRERMIPMGRLGTSEECAEATLLCIRAGYMTGQVLHLNGGLYFG